MVAALDSKSSLARGGSSSLLPGTMNKNLSYIEISRENLIYNIKQFRALVKKDTKIAAVIKSNAYGHGDLEVARIISSYADFLQVDSIEEAERVSKVSKKPILIFGYTNKEKVNRKNSPSLDRIIPSKGYVKGNIMIISYRANRIKNDSTIEELEKITSFLRSLI